MATSSGAQNKSKYVTLVSSDGFEFVVLREAACISGMIKTMLAGKPSPRSPHNSLCGVLIWLVGDYSEARKGRCEFKEIK